MSFVPIKDANDVDRNVDVFSRTEGANTVLTQAFAMVNPQTGDPVLNEDGSMPVDAQRVEDLLVMMVRIVKLLESNAVVDSAQRQRISLDAIAAGVSLPTVAAVTAVTNVTTVTTVGAQTTLAGMDREMYINQARSAYALTTRANLQFV